MIKYDFDATASYTGDVAGLAATSPAVTGIPLDDEHRRGGRLRQLRGRPDRRDQQPRSRRRCPRPRSARTTRPRTAASRRRCRRTRSASCSTTPGVAAVQQDTLNQPQDDNTSFIGATTVWPSLGGSANAGSNVDRRRASTRASGRRTRCSTPGRLAAPAGGLKGCQFGDGTDVAHLGPPFACNNKLIGAYAKMATYMANIGSDGQEFCNNTTQTCSPRDSEGHGTHTATTAAGDWSARPCCTASSAARSAASRRART